MRHHSQKLAGLLVLVACLLAVAGCMTPRQPAAAPADRPSAGAAGSDTSRWWQICFIFDWPEESSPAWHLDLLVAHRVVAPVLEKHGEAIPLWRFHRRAVRDETGHQFSLIVYAGAGISEKIFKAMQTAPDVTELQSSGCLKKMSMGPTGANGGHHIEDTSDPRWSTEVQKSWPWFIMGVSRMWLTLADEKAADSGGEDRPTTLPARIDFYKELNATITQVWQQEGAHALLHHLNAIFGYEPVVIREERLIRF